MTTRSGLMYEIRMFLAVSAVTFILWVAPKKGEGIRLIVALGEHFERELKLKGIRR